MSLNSCATHFSKGHFQARPKDNFNIKTVMKVRIYYSI
jgi:hypothetical protein